MRSLVARALVVALALSAAPATFGQVEVLAVPTTVTERIVVPFPDVAAQQAEQRTGELSVAVAAPLPFSMVGFELPDGVDELRVRTSLDGEEWGEWTTTERFDAEDGPDPEAVEASDDRSHRFAEPVWVEEARHLQVELPDGAPVDGELRAALIDSRGLSGGPVERRVVPAEPTSAEAAERPRVITRAQWGADESLARPSRAASRVYAGVVHHTATSNHYSDARAVMRSMYHYHTQQLGWSDLGYNIVVDQQGNVYEGRAGGLENGIIGAHARGYNTGSFGVSVIGNFEQIHPPQAAVDAVSRVVAWQSRVYGIDPEGWTNGITGSWHRTLIGHREVGSTSCPGRYFQPRLGEVRAAAAASLAGHEPTSAPEPAPEPVRTPPVTTITSGPSGTVAETTARLTFTATGDLSFFECQWQGGEWYPCASARTFSELADGQYTFRARAVDPDGNRESPPASRSWTVDTAPFSDIAGNPHAAAITRVSEEKIASGYADGTFRPLAEVRRDQMATFLARTRKLPDGDPSRFSDVVDGPHAGAIGAVAAAGISGGYPDGTFRPQLVVTREQMATFLTTALDLPAGEQNFADVDDDSVHAGAVGAVAAAGISEGYRDGTFRPGEPVTRGQMATFLTRALDFAAKH